MKRTLVFLAAGTTACAPTIEHFAASPQHFCPGERVNLEWRVKDAAGATLITNPDTAVAMSTAVAAVGGHPAMPSGDTVYRLSAANSNGTRAADVRVSTMNPGDPTFTYRWTQPLTCLGPNFQMETVFTLPFTVSPRLRITEIRLEPGIFLNAAALHGPGVGDPVAQAWGATFFYSGPPCPESGATNGHDGPTPPPPTSDISLFVRAECR
jgi:hypothetical protein